MAVGCAPADETSPDPTARAFQLTVDHGWPTLPDGMVFGYVTGVDVDSDGNVLTLHGYSPWNPSHSDAEPAPAVSVWSSASGELLRSWGADRFWMPHGLSVGPDDEVWITDVNQHQVFRFSNDGQLLLTLGESGVAGAGPHHFNMPTDVAVARDGTVFVGDGYGNRRVAVFDSTGVFQYEFGAGGASGTEFDIPHDLAIAADGSIAVADRQNGRIQFFEQDGTFVREWLGGGAWHPYGIDIDPLTGRVVVVDGTPTGASLIVLDSTGSEVGRSGRYGYYDGQFIMAHDVASHRDGSILVADVEGRRVQRFLPGG